MQSVAYLDEWMLGPFLLNFQGMAVFITFSGGDTFDHIFKGRTFDQVFRIGGCGDAALNIEFLEGDP